MGADLYCLGEEYRKYVELLDEWLHSTDAERVKRGKLVEELEHKMWVEHKYFRDSYNDSNLLWKLGLDYREWFDDFIEYRDLWGEKRRVISSEGCKKILDEVKRRKHMLSNIDDSATRAYFEGKYERFVRFLESCIRAGGMIASI